MHKVRPFASRKAFLPLCATFENKLLVLSRLRVETLYYYKSKKNLKSRHFFKPGLHTLRAEASSSLCKLSCGK